MASPSARPLPDVDRQDHFREVPSTSGRRTVQIRGQAASSPAHGARRGSDPATVAERARRREAEIAARHRDRSERREEVRRELAARPTRPARVEVDRALAELATPRSVTLTYERRPPRRVHEKLGPSPDRIAMWAFVMGLFLVLVAALSAHL